MGYNRSGARRSARLRRRRREVTRFVAKCESANVASKEQGGPATDYAKDIRHFRRLMKLRS
jgi:hypothetical protein